MLAVEKWAEGRPPLIALFAPQVATFAREIPEILRHQKKTASFPILFRFPICLPGRPCTVPVVCM